jgi:hypothetical protein
MYDDPSTLKERQAKIFAQFVFDFCESLRDQPNLNLDKFEQVIALLFSSLSSEI